MAAGTEVKTKRNHVKAKCWRHWGKFKLLLEIWGSRGPDRLGKNPELVRAKFSLPETCARRQKVPG